MYYPRANMLRFWMSLARHLGAGKLDKLPLRRLDECPLSMGTVLGDRRSPGSPGKPVGDPQASLW